MMTRLPVVVLTLCTLTAGLLTVTSLGPATPHASAATGCTQGNGYRNCRKEQYAGWVSVTTYPGMVKAAKSDKGNVWIDSDGGNHWAHGDGFAQTKGSKGMKWRACAWFPNQFGDQRVDCTAWAQGY